MAVAVPAWRPGRPAVLSRGRPSAVSAQLRTGGLVETNVVGREGAVGLIEASARGEMTAHVRVHAAGDAWCVSADTFQAATAQSLVAQTAVHRHTEDVMAELRQSVLCHPPHPGPAALPLDPRTPGPAWRRLDTDHPRLPRRHARSPADERVRDGQPAAEGRADQLGAFSDKGRRSRRARGGGVRMSRNVADRALHEAGYGASPRAAARAQTRNLAV